MFGAGTLGGWRRVSGDAFGAQQVVADQPQLNPSGRIPGGCHLLGVLAGGDATGELQSAPFVLGGNGQVNFLLGGGRDEQNLYVAVVDAGSGRELMRATGTETLAWPDGPQHGLRRVYWDLSQHLGKTLYFRVRDQAQGPRAYLNLDDFHVPPQSRLHPANHPSHE